MIEMKWLHEPQFKMGQEVWVVTCRHGRVNVWKDRVVRLWVELFQEDLRHRFPDDSVFQTYGVLRGYVLGCYNMDDPNSLWHQEDLYPDEASAMWNAIFHKVELTDAEWLAAIGPEDRNFEDEEGEEIEVELQKCCAQISNIRDILFECKENGGLMTRDVRRLQKALNNHEPSTSDNPILNKIFALLGVKWEEVKDGED